MASKTKAAAAGGETLTYNQGTFRNSALVRQQTLAAYLFLLPALIFFVMFVVVPMVMCLVTSFLDYRMGKPLTFVGFAQYIKMFRDPVFLKALQNTFILVIVAVPVVTAFSLWVSSVVYKMSSIKRSFYRCVFYLPVVTGTVAVAVVWKWMFNKYTGLINYVLNAVGLIDENISWLGDPRFALGCITLILFTTSIGQPIVLYVSALGNVDHSLVEAAQVDGATDFQVFWKIKWPSIMPTTLYVAVITTINSFQCFALIQLLTKGGPLNSTMTIMYQVYDTAYRLNDLGYACAIGGVLALIIAIFSAIQFKVAKTDN